MAIAQRWRELVGGEQTREDDDDPATDRRNEACDQHLDGLEVVAGRVETITRIGVTRTMRPLMLTGASVE